MNIRSLKGLNNHVNIPVLGLGVFKTTPGKETQNAVTWALEAGYRHIDTAAFYGNEEDVGIAVKNSSIPRDEIFITTKLWNSDQPYEKALKAFDTSLKKLDCDYIDLYLIHWPQSETRKEAWQALEKIYDEHRCRAVGVSNYTIKHLEGMLDYCDILPAVNQVEFSPYLYQEELHYYCYQKGIALEAYTPLTRGRKLDDPKLIAIAEKYNKTPAQILIRWCIEKELIVIPKSANKARIIENTQVFDFRLYPEDKRQLDSFDEGFRVAWDPGRIV